MRMHCVEQQSGTGGKLLTDSQCNGECTSGSCGRNMEQGKRDQQKRLDMPQLWWKDYIFVHNLPAPATFKTGMLDTERLIFQWLRKNSYQQNARYKLDNVESSILCKKGSELSISWTAKSVHDCYKKSKTLPLDLKPRTSYIR